MDLITSPSNPAVRAARKLARPSSRARAEGRFLLEGPEGIREALDAGHVPDSLLATERAAARHAGLVNLARQRGAQVAMVAEPVLATLAATTTPQGLVAVLPSRDYRQATVKPEHADTYDRLTAAADEVVVLPYETANRQAYEEANRILLERADRLVAIWDGQPGSAEKAGTMTEIVADARAAGLAVDVVWPAGAARS